jgi:trans-2,3-dihydro-3-hydroxyanthranilate isomerase
MSSPQAEHPHDARRALTHDVGDGVPFAIVDVFGTDPLTGNPLAVVDLAGSHAAEPQQVTWMQAVAREFNQAETTFVLPPTEERAHRRLRSFTAAGVEVFGAGHNALGAWWWLVHSGRVAPPADGVLVQEIGARLLEVRVSGERLTMRQEATRLGARVDPAGIAASVGLDPGSFDAAVPPRVVGTGADHLIAVVDTIATLRRADPDTRALRDVTAAAGAEGLYLAVIGRPPTVVQAHARFFNPGVGLDEDAATGTAAGPLAAYLLELGRLGPDGALTIRQGESVQRPSTIHAVAAHGHPVAITGTATLSAQGWLATAP